MTLTRKLEIFQLAKNVSLQIKIPVRDDSIKHIDISDSRDRKEPFPTDYSLILPDNVDEAKHFSNVFLKQK